MGIAVGIGDIREGYGMTNGEKIQTILDIDKDCTEVYGKNGMMTFSVPQEWWNAEYKEPTTKSDCAERDGCIHKCIDKPTEDCISRADAIQAMQDKAKKLTNEDTINGLCGAVAILFDLPSVTPQETRKGHWISTETKGVRYAFWCRYKCSLCGGLSDHTTFCPNCGARMVEPQESEDK